jgi:hypothetical protein
MTSRALPANGARPASISCMIAPIAHTSLCAVARSPWNSSGAA